MTRSLLFGAVAFFAVSARAAELFVYNTNDAFAGSLRQAIQDASPGDTILFQIPRSDPGYSASQGRFFVSLTSGSLIINKSLAIDGERQRIVIQRSSAAGTPNFQIFKIRSGTVGLANLGISNGNAEGTVESGGSAIYMNATVTLRNCAIYYNNGGGLSAIYNVHGALTLSHCTVANNSSYQTGALNNDGALAIDNCTFTGNVAQNPSTGAIYIAPNTPAQIRNTIVVGNTGSNGAVASDVTGPFVSGGYNLIGTTIGSTGFGATGDQLGVTPAAAKLSALQEFGGPTYTVRPQPGSVAIDQGKRGVDVNGQPFQTDSRGYPRPVDLAIPNAVGGDGSDIGAVEVGPLQGGPAFTVTNAADHNFNDEGCTTDDCTLSEALKASNANPDTNTITFASDIGPQIMNSFAPSGLAITAPVNIIGPGARQLAVSGGNISRIFIVSAQSVTISGLTLTDGKGASGDGAAVYNSGGLTLTDCTLQYSAAIHSGSVGGNGGGLFNASGATALLSGCTFFSNSASDFGGGGIFNGGNVTATDCTFTGNVAPAGGGILSISNNGTSLTTLRNCTITNNTATEASAAGSGGGGYYGEGGFGNTLHRFSNTILAGNINAQNPDLRGYGASQGNNIIGNLGASGSGFSNGVNGDKVGVSPGLDSFANNGGPTNTWSLLNTSVAINMGNNALAPSTDQRGFTRNGVSDIGAFEFNAPVPPVLLVSAVSHKSHGATAGGFDIDLPISGSVGVETRSGGASSNHTIILTFSNPLVSVGSAAIGSGIGSVTSATIRSDAHQYVVNLAGVGDQQRLTLVLNSVTDLLGHQSASVPLTVGFLVGDVSGDSVVNAGDVTITRTRSGLVTDATNFRTDYNVDGSINSSDVTIVRGRSGNFLP